MRVAAMASRATPSTRPRRAGEGSSARRDAVAAAAREHSRRARRAEGSRHITQVDIFGEEKLEDLSDEEQPVQREQPSTLSRFEPQLLKEYYVSQDDENIRRRDIPERLQCRQLPTVRRRRAQFERDLDEESRWVASKMKKSSDE